MALSLELRTARDITALTKRKDTIQKEITTIDARLAALRRIADELKAAPCATPRKRKKSGAAGNPVV